MQAISMLSVVFFHRASSLSLLLSSLEISPFLSNRAIIFNSLNCFFFFYYLLHVKCNTFEL